jgi:hypothetical protein
MMKKGLDLIEEEIPEEDHRSDNKIDKEIAEYFGDWAEDLAIISKRRNLIERKLRSISINFIRFSALSGGGNAAANGKERVLKCIDAKRRADLEYLDLENIMGKLYWLELAALIKKEWALFEKIFGDRARFTAMFHLTFPRTSTRLSVVKEIGHAEPPFRRAIS